MIELSDKKLVEIKEAVENGNVKIMIMGLGSVGCYVLDYLVSLNDPSLDIIVVGRSKDSMMQNVNIINVASVIRNQNKSRIKIVHDCDFNSVQNMEQIITQEKPHIILNSSRVYSGLKYGTISWSNLRAYGIWSPLAIKYIKNIMKAVQNSNTDPIVINTSYSDAVIPWLKSAGELYPDFGSGNLNHLIPRIKFAVAAMHNINDYYNIDVTLATSHFHDVVISKEGTTENLDVLLNVKYNGKNVNVNKDKIFSLCSIPMPTDAKRNMMNASSNFNIIYSIINSIKKQTIAKFHTPGVLGEMGGYPFIIDGKAMKGYVDESIFTLQQMREANKKSIYLDGIQSVDNGTLNYTDELIEKVKKAFNVNLFKSVKFCDIDKSAEFIIEEIIKPNAKN